MDKALIQLLKKDKNADIKEFLDEKSAKEIKECITTYVLKGSSDPVPLVGRIISASLSEEEKSLERCSTVYISIIRLLQKNEINSKTAFSIVSILLTNLENLQPRCLSDLANSFVASVKNGSYNGGKVAELLPKILSLINECETLPYGEGDMKGSEFKGHIINSLCASKWLPSVAIHMAALFNDIPLTLEELKFVIEKIVRLFGELDLADQPAIAFQLLKLSAKGHKRSVLEGIIRHFTVEDEKNRGRTLQVDSEDLLAESTCLTTLRQIQGTIILHVMQAVKQNRKLGSELIKYAKSIQLCEPHRVVAPFPLSLLLCVSQLHQFEEQIFELVKSSILKCFRDEERQNQSLWIRECFTIGPKTDDLILEAVEHSTHDWDHVVHGLVKLGFSLMDNFGPKLVFGAMPDPVMTSNLNPSQKACKLGQKMLLKTFKAHEVVRSEILDQIFTYIVMKSTSPVSHYLELLTDVVQSAPQLLLEASTTLQDVFMKLAHLPLAAAQGVITAVQPLLKLRPQLKDSLILVLRKAMFSRQITARKIGAIGFLMILKNFRVVGGLPSSQVSQPISLSQMVDVHTQYNAASNEALCLEILGNLRRSFVQQADVRLSIYSGMYEVLHRNSQLQAPVLEMLLAQLRKYYEHNTEASPPLRLEPCILTQGDSVFLAEPLGHLLKCIQQGVKKALFIISQQRQMNNEDEEEEEEDEENPLNQLKKIMADLTTRIIEADMDDFELDKSADFSCINSVGVKNNIYAILLLNTYEVLMEYAFETGNFSAESCANIIKLYTKHTKLSSVLKDKGSKGNKGRPQTSTTSKIANSLLSLDCVSNMLNAIIEDQSPDHNAGLAVLRGNKEFMPYLVTVAHQKLGQVTTKGVCEGEPGSADHTMQQCCRLGRLFFIHYCENQTVSDDNSQAGRDRRLTTACVEGLALVTKLATDRGHGATLMALGLLEKESIEEAEKYVPESARAEKIHKHIKKFERLVTTVVESGADLQNWKEAQFLLSIIEHLTSQLSPVVGSEFTEVYTWITKLVTEAEIADATTCKQLLSFMLKMARQTKNLPQFLRNLCQDIHSQSGDVDPDCTVDESTHFSLTKSEHMPAASVFTLSLAALELELDDLDWVIKRHRAAMLSAGGPDTSGDEDMSSTQVENMDRSLCTRLGMLCNAFIELTHSNIKPKSNTQLLLKALTKLYNTITALTKHYISLYANKAGHLGSRFEKLITLVGKQLTKPTYEMITFAQSSENEAEGNEKKDKGKKKGAGTSASAQAGMAKAMKQMKTIPNLIFAIEQLEKFLILLSKKSKVDLMEHIKVSTSRDFRIQADAVVTVVEQGMSDDSEGNNSDASNEDGEEVSNSGDNSDNNQENTAPPETQNRGDDPPKKKTKKK